MEIGPISWNRHETTLLYPDNHYSPFRGELVFVPQQDLQLLTPESVSTLLNPTVPDEPEHGVFWETAVSDLSTALFDESIVGHSGSDPGAGTFMYFNPETKLGAVILMNSNTHAAEEASVNILLQILGSEGTGQMFSP